MVGCDSVVWSSGYKMAMTWLSKTAPTLTLVSEFLSFMIVRRRVGLHDLDIVLAAGKISSSNGGKDQVMAVMSADICSIAPTMQSSVYSNHSFVFIVISVFEPVIIPRDRALISP